MDYEKDSLRRLMLDRRSALSEDFQVSAAKAIEERLFSRVDWRDDSPIGLYWAVRGEVPTRGIFQRLTREGVSVCLPRLDLEGLEFAGVRSEADLSAGAWGILAPDPKLPVVPVDRLGAILIPGVAFDLRGGRLGWGKGYFDRLLRGYHGKRWALAYDFQVLEKIPTDAHDEGVDGIFTESRMIEVGGPSSGLVR